MARGGYRPNSGRPKAQHTIQAEAAKADLIKRFLKEKKPIFDALINEAKGGNLQAIREVFERVWGKESQPFSGDLNHTFDDIPPELYKSIIERESRRIKVSSD